MASEDKGAEKRELERKIRYYEHHERKAEEQLDLAGVEKIDNEERSDSTDDSAGQPWSIWMRIKFLRRQISSAKVEGRREGEDKGRARLATLADQQLNGLLNVANAHYYGGEPERIQQVTDAIEEVRAALHSDQADTDTKEASL